MDTISEKHHLHPGEFSREGRRLLRKLHLPLQSTSLDYLGEIARKFSRLPYENISKILKFSKTGQQASFRMPDEIFHDFLASGLGGTCFSLTYYLLEILRETGFDCHPVMGDMKWGENVHCAILVDYHRKTYLVDPGYMIYQPLLISKDDRLRHLTPHSGIEIRFDQSEERYDLYTFRSGNFTWRYRFTDRPVDMEEFARHWAESFHKPTMNGICLTRVVGDRMIYIHNDYTKITGKKQTNKETSRDMAEKTIQRQFGIPLELVEEARYILHSRSGNRDLEAAE